MSGFPTSVTPVFFYGLGVQSSDFDGTLTNFLGQVFRRKGFLPFKGCRVVSGGGFDLMERRTLCGFKTGTDVGVLP